MVILRTEEKLEKKGEKVRKKKRPSGMEGFIWLIP